MPGRLVNLFISFFLIFTSVTIAQHNPAITFENVSSDQGLSSNRINGLLQDQSGFLWITTNNGLNRFDGVENKTYTKQIGDTTSLSNNTILTQYCDQNNQLWFLTVNYLHRYDEKQDHFDRFLLTDKKESSRYGSKGALASDSEGNIWVGTPTNGLYVLQKSAGKCKRILPQISSVSALFFDRDQRLWIGGEDGMLCVYQPLQQSLKQYQVPMQLRRTLIEDFTRKIWQDPGGKINLMLSSGFFQFDPSTEQFSSLREWNTKVNYRNNELRSLYFDEKSVWVGTQGSGLYIFQPGSDQVSHCEAISDNPGSLSNNSITAIIKDSQGVYWIATSDGLNKYDPTMKLFAHYQKIPNNPNSLHYNFVSSFCESPDGKIWVGTFGQGISIFDRKNETFQILKKEEGNPESLIDNAVRAVIPDQAGHIWVGTTNGLSCYNLQTRRFTNYKQSGKVTGLISDDITSLMVSSDQQLYIGTNGFGVSRCSLDPFVPDQFTNYTLSNSRLSSGRVRKILELHNGVVAFGTLGGGLNLLVQGQIKSISLSEVSKSVDSDYINALGEDKDHNLWVGSWDGLFLLDSTLRVIKMFNTPDGIPANEISGILTDEKGDIWVSSMNGLSHLTKIGANQYKITNYTPHNGLQGSYFTTYSTLKTRDGELFFGGYNGFNRFNPEKIGINKEAPKVIFTDFQVFNQSVPINKSIYGRVLLNENITETRSITLNYKHRVIGFRFAAMTTSQVEKVRYACKMEGIDPDWVYLDYNRRFISYNNLPSGEYKFTVKACNADGIWGDPGTSITIKMLPPFWKTWYAFLFYALLISGLLYLVREYSLSRARLENQAQLERIHREKDAEINALKIKFFINISHEIRTPLSLIVAPLEKLLHTQTIGDDLKKHLQIMYGNTQRLLTLINQLLDFRKIETGNVHLHVAPYDIVAFISGIKDAFAESAARKNIALSLESNEKALSVWFDPDAMGKIMFNLLSNAIKFTLQGGSIRLVINHVQEKMQCEILVRDSGIGVPADKLEKLFDRFYQVDSKSFVKQDTVGSGIGLSIVKNLIELHGAQISVESAEGEFTQFRLIFSTDKSHLKNNDQVTLSEEPAPYSLSFSSVLSVEDEANDPFDDQVQESEMKKNVKILIVEDNPEIRYYLKQSLQESYDTIGAADGKVGYELALEHIPDLIITDVMMPERDGIELCRMLKNEMLTQHIPVIILSAKSTIEDTLEGLETGADDYIPKPFNEQILLAKVRTLLSNRQKLIEKYRVQPEVDNQEADDSTLNFDDPFVNRVVDFIRTNISDESLSNERIEAHFKTSKMQLYRKLKAVTGWSVNSLIREVRITEAKKLLRNPELNISEIAYQLGFSDPLYFSKYFKKEVGVAPVQYRKEQQ